METAIIWDIVFKWIALPPKLMIVVSLISPSLHGKHDYEALASG